MDKLFVYTPLAIVVYILWAQCIAVNPKSDPPFYGQTVCGWLTVVNLAIITALIIFYFAYYRRHLENKIKYCES